MSSISPQAVLDFWVGPLDAEGLATETQSRKWYEKNPAFDAEVKDRFLVTYNEIRAGSREDWRTTAEGAAAYIIVLDQFSRNMFRDRGEMYDGDAQALEAAVQVVDEGKDAPLPNALRAFVYMPFMHSEDLSHQKKCVELFEAFNRGLSEKALPGVGQYLDYALQHHAIVAQWGRFPHRNTLLGRESTPEELAFLKQPGSSF